MRSQGGPWDRGKASRAALPWFPGSQGPPWEPVLRSSRFASGPLKPHPIGHHSNQRRLSRRAGIVQHRPGLADAGGLPRVFVQRNTESCKDSAERQSNISDCNTVSPLCWPRHWERSAQFLQDWGLTGLGSFFLIVIQGSRRSSATLACAAVRFQRTRSQRHSGTTECGVTEARKSKSESRRAGIEVSSLGFPRPAPRSPLPAPRSPVPGPRSPLPGSRSPVPGPRSPFNAFDRRLSLLRKSALSRERKATLGCRQGVFGLPATDLASFLQSGYSPAPKRRRKLRVGSRMPNCGS